MSFPPYLGITSAFLIESRSPIAFQELPSLLPSLERLHSQFSKPGMKGYSRIRKPGSTKSMSLDFADLSSLNHKPAATIPQNNSNLELKSHKRNITCHSIPEHRNEDGLGETFGVLGRNCRIPSAPCHRQAVHQRNLHLPNASRKSCFIRRSSSISERYCRIHLDSATADVNKDAAKLYVKRKGKFLKACKRLLGL